MEDGFAALGLAQALLMYGGNLIVTTDNGDEAMVGMFDDQLRFLLSCAHTDVGFTDRGLYNIRAPAIAASGKELVLSEGNFGCLLTLSPRTLFDANPDSSVPTCWNAGNQQIDATALFHLGP